MDQDDIGRMDQIFFGEYEKRFKNGDMSAVLNCLFYCLSSQPKTPIPEWCAEAFCNAYRKVISCEFRSWDDVFRRPHPKGINLGKEHDLYEARMAVYHRVEQLKKDPKAVVDNWLFERVGKELGVGGKTLTEAHYYFVRNCKRAMLRYTELIAAGQVADLEAICKEYGVDEIFIRIASYDDR